MERTLHVGDKVRLLVPCLNNPVGALGVVYEEYDIGAGPGAAVIFVNGDYDGFSVDEQKRLLSHVGHEPLCADYAFHNVIRLQKDFWNGYFKPAFSCKHGEPVLGCDMCSPEDDIEQARRLA